ncbi:MAG: tetratricopeptide repeat protein [Candidatus Thorarchaeota archaeon]
MSRVSELILPPEEVYRKIWGSRKNVEHIILWLLKNNEIVEWADFLEEPISIPQSTLSNYLKSLFLDDYIKKVKRGEYKITMKGRDRFNELSKAKVGKRRLNYPPKVIGEKRNYDHIILWMAYNNNYLKWSDFLDDKTPIFINQSALSKNINLLLKKDLVRKNDNKEYKITQTGKAEYARILKLYDLDRQSILNEESKRIEGITKKTIQFFERHNIKKIGVKFRFLDYILTLPFEKLKGSLDNEDDFKKIVLFFSINHPDQYPVYISPTEFSKKYEINKLDLEFNIRKIVEKNTYPTKFFKLEVDNDKNYYFKANEKIEKILRAITENHITQFAYLNKLYEKIPSGVLPFTLESVVNVILNEICDHLFDVGLREGLKAFLPGYINYLAYKMETKKKLEELTDKLEGTIWQEFQYYSSGSDTSKEFDGSQENYYLIANIFDIIDDYYIVPSISSIVNEVKEVLKDKYRYKKALDIVNATIKKGLNDIEFKLFKARVLCHVNKFVESIKLIEEEIDFEQFRDDEGIYIASSFILVFSYTSLGTPKEALEIIDNVIEVYPNHPIVLAAKALVYGYSVIYDFDVGDVNEEYVLDLIDEVINVDPNILNKARYYQFKSSILEQMDKEEEALEEIDIALSLTDQIVDLYYSKSKILTELEKYDEAISILEENMKRFPGNKRQFLMQKAYVLKILGNYEIGLQIIEEIIKQNPEELELYNSKAYWHIYIYSQKRDKGIEDEENKKAAIKTIKALTEKAPYEGNYFDSYGEILMTIGDYESSIKLYEKAIKTEPTGWFIPSSHVGLGKCYEQLGIYDKAKAHFQEARKIVRYCFCHIKHKKEWIEDIEYHMKKLEDLDKD